MARKTQKERLEQLVTKDYLKERIERDPIRTIGRILVAIFKRQTANEKAGNHTEDKNGIGFSGHDARIGSLGAKYFMKHGTLLEWQLKSWIRPDKHGYPRIAKYVRQLNEIANEKTKQHGTVTAN